MAIKNKKNTEYKQEGTVITTLEVKDVREIKNRKNCYFFTAIINGITIYSMRYITYIDDKGDEKSFVACPSEAGKNGKYYNTVYLPIDSVETAWFEDLIEKALNEE